MILLYLRRRIERRPADFVTLFLVLFLAIFSASTISSIFDGAFWGRQINNYERHGGAYLYLLNADDDDTDYLKERGINFEVRDDKVYIKEDEETSRKLMQDMLARVNDGESGCGVVWSGEINKFYDENLTIVYVITAFALLPSLFAIRYSVRVFILRQSRNLGIMRALGINGSKMYKSLSIQLLSALLPAFAAAIPAGNFASFLITKYFFRIEGSNLMLGKTVWHFSPKLAVFLFILVTAVAFAAFLRLARQIEKTPPAEGVRLPEDCARPGSTVSVMEETSATRRIISAGILRQRKLTSAALAITIPAVLFIYTAIFYSNLDTNTVSRPDIIVAESAAEPHPEEMKARIQTLSGFDGIKEMNFQTSYNNLNLKRFSDDNLPGYTSIGDRGGWYHITLYLFDENSADGRKAAEYDTELFSKPMHILVNSRLKRHLPIGSVIESARRAEGETTKLTVSGYFESGHTGFFDIYAKKADYEELSGFEAVPNRIEIYAASGADIDGLFGEISALFPEDRFNLVNNKTEAAAEAELMRSLNALALISAAPMLLSAALSLAAFVAEDISSKKKKWTTIHNCGLDDGGLIRLISAEYALRGAMNIAALMLAALVVYLLMRAAFPVSVKLSAGAIIFSLAATAVTTAAYILPAVASGKKMLPDETGRQKTENAITEAES
ncbi:MAG: ABC transporter permease [Clostridiales bacterium]|nr:ABC transporter permease [Clostridiales bacterium]